MAGLRKAFGAVDVQKVIDLEPPRGALGSLQGPSGCGKSKLLRCIAGLEDLTGGAIHQGEREATGMPSARGDIAMVYLNYTLYPPKSVRKNKALGLAPKAMPRTEINTLTGASLRDRTFT